MAGKAKDLGTKRNEKKRAPMPVAQASRGLPNAPKPKGAPKSFVP